jgi:hypothetical protein
MYRTSVVFSAHRGYDGAYQPSRSIPPESFIPRETNPIEKWTFTRIVRWVKTRVELDKQKLLRVIQLTGLKTRKEAIDYALSQAERAAKIAKLFARPRRSKEKLKNLLNPKYDLMMLREQEKPDK